MKSRWYPRENDDFSAPGCSSAPKLRGCRPRRHPPEVTADLARPEDQGKPPTTTPKWTTTNGNNNGYMGIIVFLWELFVDIWWGLQGFYGICIWRYHGDYSVSVGFVCGYIILYGDNHVSMGFVCGHIMGIIVFLCDCLWTYHGHYSVSMGFVYGYIRGMMYHGSYTTISVFSDLSWFNPQAKWLKRAWDSHRLWSSSGRQPWLATLPEVPSLWLNSTVPSLSWDLLCMCIYIYDYICIWMYKCRDTMRYHHA